MTAKQAIRHLQQTGMTLEQIATATGVRLKTLDRLAKTSELPSTSALGKLLELVRERTQA